MVKVKLLVSRAGVHFAQAVGDIITVSQTEADILIARSQAELVEPPKAEPPKVEKKPARKTKPDEPEE